MPTEPLPEDPACLRGAYLQKFVRLESAVSGCIAEYFDPHSHERYFPPHGYGVFDRMILSWMTTRQLIDLLQRLLKEEGKGEVKPSFKAAIKKVRDCNDDRNIFAHWMLGRTRSGWSWSLEPARAGDGYMQ